jgi:hypothetical protein
MHFEMKNTLKKNSNLEKYSINFIKVLVCIGRETCLP